MDNATKEMKVLQTENMSQGVVITFSNGEAVLFHHHFLYEVRHEDGNVALVVEGEDD